MEVKTRPCKNCGRDIVRYSEECFHCGAPTWLGILPAVLVIALLCVLGVARIVESGQHTSQPAAGPVASSDSNQK